MLAMLASLGSIPDLATGQTVPHTHKHGAAQNTFYIWLRVFCVLFKPVCTWMQRTPVSSSLHGTPLGFRAIGSSLGLQEGDWHFRGSPSLQWPFSSLDTEESGNLHKVASVTEGESAIQGLASRIPAGADIRQCGGPSQWLDQIYRTQEEPWCGRHSFPPDTTCWSRCPSCLQNHLWQDFSDLSPHTSLLSQPELTCPCTLSPTVGSF